MRRRLTTSLVLLSCLSGGLLAAGCSSEQSSTAPKAATSDQGAEGTPPSGTVAVESEADEGETDESETGEDTSSASTATVSPPIRCAPASGAGEVVVWHVLTNEAAGRSFEEDVTEFNASQPDIRVVAERVELGTEGLLARLADTDPEEWPDLILSQPQALRRLVDTNRIVPPDECGAVEAVVGRLLPVVRASYSIDDTLQAVPYGVSTPILLFDAAEYRAAGLDPADPPTTLDELASASRQIVESGASPYGLVVYDWYGTFLINQGAAQRGDLVAEPANGRRGGPLTVDYRTPENWAATEWMKRVVAEDGGVFIGGIPSGLENLLKIVDRTEGGTMTIQTSGALGDLIEILEAGSYPGVELAVGPMPGPGSGGLVGGNGFWLVDHGDPVRTANAYEVARWMVEPVRLADYIVRTGYIPPSFDVAFEPAVLQRWEEYPQLRVGFDQLATQSESDADAGAVFGPSVEIDYVFYRFTNRVMNEEMSVDEALDQLTVDVQAELDRYQAIVGG